MARSKKHRRNTGFKIPLGVVAGFAPLVHDTYLGAKGGGFKGALEGFTYDLTGYMIDSNTWKPEGMVRGWVPIIAGFVAHKLAGVFGINRLLGRAKIPLIRI